MAMGGMEAGRGAVIDVKEEWRSAERFEEDDGVFRAAMDLVDSVLDGTPPLGDAAICVQAERDVATFWNARGACIRRNNSRVATLGVTRIGASVKKTSRRGTRKEFLAAPMLSNKKNSGLLRNSCPDVNRKNSDELRTALDTLNREVFRREYFKIGTNHIYEME
eukprot:CAMPEP_0185845088 /NCGR_PEP_ID=MMETSP1354-20130828/1149_1 /TAXON_ID=708628 /ORGANISM="Erythrolobus madagascarensis, Strain CCMP3276" /LENGTH=163 /DNA_ID=CAMNT_0028544965 /DNA_START=23 /DNA_END=514 /DNA_ORIENTATION=-